MSTIKYVILSLAILTTAIEAKKILRAQEGATKTGKFMVSLDLDTPDERFDELAEMVGVHAADQDVKKLNGEIAKIITAALSESALETVRL